MYNLYVLACLNCPECARNLKPSLHVVFTVSDEKLDSEGRPGNKAVEEVVCTGYKNALYILSYRWASLIREHIEVHDYQYKIFQSTAWSSQLVQSTDCLQN